MKLDFFKPGQTVLYWVTARSAIPVTIISVREDHYAVWDDINAKSIKAKQHQLTGHWVERSTNVLKS